jgi:hypothetical protein
MYTLEFQLSHVPKHLHHPVISVALGMCSNKHPQRLQPLTTLSYIPRCGEEPVPATLWPLFAEEADHSLLFRRAGSAEERRTVVTVALRAKVARALGVTVEVDAEKTLAECTSYRVLWARALVRASWLAAGQMYSSTSSREALWSHSQGLRNNYYQLRDYRSLCPRPGLYLIWNSEHDVGEGL